LGGTQHLPHRERRLEGVFLPRWDQARGARVVTGQGVVDALLAEGVAAGEVVRVSKKAVADETSECTNHLKEVGAKV